MVSGGGDVVAIAFLGTVSFGDVLSLSLQYRYGVCVCKKAYAQMCVCVCVLIGVHQESCTRLPGSDIINESKYVVL